MFLFCLWTPDALSVGHVPRKLQIFQIACAAEAICNICIFLRTCPTDSALGVKKQKVDILENLEELHKCILKDQMVKKFEKLK